MPVLKFIFTDARADKAGCRSLMRRLGPPRTGSQPLIIVSVNMAVNKNFVVLLWSSLIIALSPDSVACNLIGVETSLIRVAMRLQT